MRRISNDEALPFDEHIDLSNEGSEDRVEA
jgi:hypothetical protein